MNLTTKKINIPRIFFSSVALASILGGATLTASNPAQAEQYETNNKKMPNILIAQVLENFPRARSKTSRKFNRNLEIRVSDGNKKVIKTNGEFWVNGELLGIGEWVSPTRYVVFVQRWGNRWWIGDLTSKGMLTTTVLSPNEIQIARPSNLEPYTTPVKHKRVKGDNVIKVKFNGGASFVNVNYKVWEERGSDGRKAFNFRETGRDEWSVYLVDDSRGVRIQIDLWQKDIIYSDLRGKKFVLAKVEEAFSKY